jgi:hypothetical protein
MGSEGGDIRPCLGGTGNAGFLTFPMGPSAVEPIIDALTRDVELARRPAHAYVLIQSFNRIVHNPAHPGTYSAAPTHFAQVSYRGHFGKHMLVARFS